MLLRVLVFGGRRVYHNPKMSQGRRRGEREREFGEQDGERPGEMALKHVGKDKMTSTRMSVPRKTPWCRA